MYWGVRANMQVFPQRRTVLNISLLFIPVLLPIEFAYPRVSFAPPFIPGSIGMMPARFPPAKTLLLPVGFPRSAVYVPGRTFSAILLRCCRGGPVGAPCCYGRARSGTPREHPSESQQTYRCVLRVAACFILVPADGCHRGCCRFGRRPEGWPECRCIPSSGSPPAPAAFPRYGFRPGRKSCRTWLLPRHVRLRCPCHHLHPEEREPG